MNLLAQALAHIALSMPDSLQWSARKRMIEEASREVDKLVKPLDADVREFHIQFGHPAPASATMPPRSVMDFRVKLIREETEELCAAIERRDLGAVAQESCDLIYVVLGTLVVCGLRLAPFWSAVQKSNMEKIPNPTGGKPLKPEGWKKPDCGAIVGAWSDQEPKTPCPVEGS